MVSVVPVFVVAPGGGGAAATCVTTCLALVLEKEKERKEQKGPGRFPREKVYIYKACSLEEEYCT